MSRAPKRTSWVHCLHNKALGFGLLVLLLSFFTYFWNYTNPPYLYWDENYHISSAQKYLNGVFFMEPHPPLGKLMIAAGEWIMQMNEESDTFIGTDYAKELPTGFSFLGYRFFPALLGWLTAPLLYLIFLAITRKPLWAVFFSFLYVFDNALITHSRAAMLDSTMLFFIVLMIALYYGLLEWKEYRHRFPLCSLLFGATFGCLMTTKALGLIMVLFFPLVLLHLRTKKAALINIRPSTFDTKKILPFLALSVGAFLVVYGAVWHLHFSLGKQVVDSLPDNGYYKASEPYKNLIDAGKTHFPVMLADNLRFLGHYAKGVPTLNLCKEDENGSPFFFWPLGARSISYRWETPNGGVYKYIYLQVNPVVWGLSLIGLLLAFALLVSQWVSDKKGALTYGNDILIWFSLWLAYMIAVSQIDRVMYLYHYFIPLLFSFILFAYIFLELKQLGSLKLTENKKQWILLGCATLMFVSFHFYRPLTYYEPISDTAFNRRALFPLWDLECVHCDRRGLIATPLPNTND